LNVSNDSTAVVLGLLPLFDLASSNSGNVNPQIICLTNYFEVNWPAKFLGGTELLKKNWWPSKKLSTAVDK
jgi:hypothetical protein